MLGFLFLPFFVCLGLHRMECIMPSLEMRFELQIIKNRTVLFLVITQPHKHAQKLQDLKKTKNKSNALLNLVYFIFVLFLVFAEGSVIMLDWRCGVGQLS